MNFPKLFWLFFLLLLISITPLFSQKIIALKNEKINLHLNDYFIAKVIDKRQVKDKIGIVLNENYEKESLNLNGSLPNVLMNYLQRNFQKPPNSFPILLIINELSIQESKKSDGQIDGKCQLSVTFEKVIGYDTLKIAQAKTGNNFTRTRNFNDDKYEEIIRLMLTTSLQYLNNWLDKNASKSEAFAKGSKVILLPDAFGSDEDTLYFATRKLNWSDFRGRIPASHFAAAVFPSIGYEAHFTVRNGFIEAQILPKVFVVRGMSWAKSDSKNDYALAHEQVHFNIAKVVMEHFKQKILTLQEPTMDDLNSRIQYEYLESFREMNKLQEAYDGETNHGIYEGKQHQWAEKVAKWLAEFKN